MFTGPRANKTPRGGHVHFPFGHDQAGASPAEVSPQVASSFQARDNQKLAIPKDYLPDLHGLRMTPMTQMTQMPPPLHKAWHPRILGQSTQVGLQETGITLGVWSGRTFKKPVGRQKFRWVPIVHISGGSSPNSQPHFRAETETRILSCPAFRASRLLLSQAIQALQHPQASHPSLCL